MLVVTQPVAGVDQLVLLGRRCGEAARLSQLAFEIGPGGRRACFTTWCRDWRGEGTAAAMDGDARERLRRKAGVELRIEMQRDLFGQGDDIRAIHRRRRQRQQGIGPVDRNQGQAIGNAELDVSEAAGLRSVGDAQGAGIGRDLDRLDIIRRQWC